MRFGEREIGEVGSKKKKIGRYNEREYGSKTETE